jgi:hypothetical protein
MTRRIKSRKALLVAATLVLWPMTVFAEAELLTTREAWTACPSIGHTNALLSFDVFSSDCEQIKPGSQMVVEQKEQAPAQRWMCIDHPHSAGAYTLCNWHTFNDEPKTWLCVRTLNAGGPCKWGPAEYFTSKAWPQSRSNN